MGLGFLGVVPEQNGHLWEDRGPFDDASQKRVAGALRLYRGSCQWMQLAPGTAWRIIYLNSW